MIITTLVYFIIFPFNFSYEKSGELLTTTTLSFSFLTGFPLISNTRLYSLHTTGIAAQSANVVTRHEGHSEDVAQPPARGGRPAVALGRHLHVAAAPLPVHRVALRLADRPRLQSQHARRTRQRTGNKK